ncbi:hypothetical protein JOC75_001004 [Metabacillus crassostreae]|uniref:hypothetical protein n=1 Tax=Metabacillus crassostreae TaxID=929098 RepID=UPI00195C4D47|nr:hypothetical protein [Metabacillus crassostreae]MBM7603034.1 hypothetical protein [Metabacillus crassostreae]
MDNLEITHMTIDDGFNGEESVTTDFTHNHKDYSITFKKSDLEVINTWLFEEETSLPANLSESMIEYLREEVKKNI